MSGSYSAETRGKLYSRRISLPSPVPLPDREKSKNVRFWEKKTCDWELVGQACSDLHSHSSGGNCTPVDTVSQKQQNSNIRHPQPLEVEKSWCWTVTACCKPALSLFCLAASLKYQGFLRLHGTTEINDGAAIDLNRTRTSALTCLLCCPTSIAM